MPFPMKIQPIDSQSYGDSVNYEATAKPVLKLRLKRLFDRQFLRNNSEKTNGAGEVKDDEFEPSSVCLAKMVQNFIEDTAPGKPKCGRNRCNCFNGNINDTSDEEFDLSFFGDAATNPNSWPGDSSEILKNLTPCASVAEKNLLADTSKIIEKNKICKRKDELRKIVADGLIFLGHDTSICKSHWEKSPFYPAGEYEYIDVIVDAGDRVLIDIDFRSEFEIARPTENYKAILQSLPYIFVGKADRLQQILSIVSEAAKQSLKKKGMHLPPWRKLDYMNSKWLSEHIRTTPSPSLTPASPPTPPPTPNNAVAKETDSLTTAKHKNPSVSTTPLSGVSELIFGEKKPPSRWPETETSRLVSTGFRPLGKSNDSVDSSSSEIWQPPAMKLKNVERGSKVVVTGLASLFREKA